MARAKRFPLHFLGPVRATPDPALSQADQAAWQALPELLHRLALAEAQMGIQTDQPIPVALVQRLLRGWERADPAWRAALRAVSEGEPAFLAWLAEQPRPPKRDWGRTYLPDEDFSGLVEWSERPPMRPSEGRLQFLPSVDSVSRGLFDLLTGLGYGPVLLAWVRTGRFTLTPQRMVSLSAQRRQPLGAFERRLAQLTQDWAEAMVYQRPLP